MNIAEPAAPHRNSLLIAAIATVVAGAGIASPRASSEPTVEAAAPGVPDDDATIAHALSRLTYGARSGEMERVRATGLARWIDAQLRPENVPDPELEQRLAGLRTIGLTTAELREKYEVPPNVRQELQREAAKRQEQSGGGTPEDMTPQQRREMLGDMREKFPELAKMEGNPRQVIDELQQAKLLRAIHSERQLNEVLVDFWFNHFNVFARKGPVEFMVNEYERDVIRKHAWGRFEDLLLATAQSPAMLFYLDNWQSSDPNAGPPLERNSMRRPGAAVGGRQRPGGGRGPGGQMPGVGDGARPQPSQQRRPGLNENYARELMELHTLGVDGGYTQADVVSVAQAFTGWTIRGEGPFGRGVRRGGDAGFWFDERRHVKGDKVVLGRTIRNGGEREGREIIATLANHPSTARFVSKKLAQRFVADEPPPSLVERAAATFTRTRGDIREVLRTILTSEEFLGPKYRAAKVKTPLEFVASAVRTSGADVTHARALARKLGEMGMPPYMQQPPTGYRDVAEEWVSTSSLLARMNFALDLAAGRIPGVRVAPPANSAHLDAVAARLIPAGLSPKSRETLVAEAEKDPSAVRMVGLVLGSPEFQRR